jgi:ribonuclease HI
MGKLNHSRHLGYSARTNRVLNISADAHNAYASRQGALQRLSSDCPKATIDIAVATKEGRTAYGIVITTDKGTQEFSAVTRTTPQRTVLLAADAALRALQSRHRVDVASSEGYLVESFSEGRVGRWKREGWITREGRKVQSQDLWLKLIAHGERHAVKYQFKQGPERERAEFLAEVAVLKRSREDRQAQRIPKGVAM